MVVVIVVMHTPKRSKSSRQMLLLMVAMRMLQCPKTFLKAMAFKMLLFPTMTRSWLRKVSRFLQQLSVTSIRLMIIPLIILNPPPNITLIMTISNQRYSSVVQLKISINSRLLHPLV